MEEAEGQLDVMKEEGVGTEEEEGPMTGVQEDLEVDGDRATGGQDDDVITDCDSLILQCCNKCFLHYC